jgi:IclR family transcriptional regulator, KDG regulon repressor
MKTKRDFAIQSVKRATEILSLFTLERPRIGITEIGALLQLNKGTAQGLIRTLTQQGFLRQDPETRKYALGIRVHELGLIFAGGLEINQKAMEPIHQLAQKTEKLVRMAIMDKDSAVVTLEVHPRTVPLPFYSFGPRIPLYCTALGKALLAFSEKDEVEDYIERVKLIRYTPNTITKKAALIKDLQKARKRGFSINREEHLLSRVSVGAPIFGREERLEASISLGADAHQCPDQKIGEWANDLRVTAAVISRRMGYSLGYPVLP